MTSTIDETELKRRIAALPSRAEKTRAVAAWLFFEVGEYPSAQRVREITGLGSASDIARDLRVFWDDVRARLKVRLTSPGLPQEVIDHVEAFLASVWTLAQEKADEHLNEARAGMEKTQAETRQHMLQAQAEAASARAHAQFLQERVDHLQEQAEKDAAEQSALQERIEALKRAQSEQEAATADLIAEKDAIHDALRATLKEREDTYRKQLDTTQGEVNFAKMQIENARAEARHWKSEFERERADATLRIAPLEQRLNAAREQVGQDQIRAQDAQNEAAFLRGEVARLREQLRGLRSFRKAQLRMPR
jgi:cell division septum initiation protein DivIVA